MRNVFLILLTLSISIVSYGGEYTQVRELTGASILNGAEMDAIFSPERRTSVGDLRHFNTEMEYKAVVSLVYGREQHSDVSSRTGGLIVNYRLISEDEFSGEVQEHTGDLTIHYAKVILFAFFLIR